MKISRKVNAPASFIFDQLIASSLYDIKRQTGDEVDRSHLKGYKYTKTFQSNQKAQIAILDVQENATYQFQTSTALREFVTSYQLAEVSATSCVINCEEQLTSRGSLQKWNDLLVGAILGWQKKRQMKVMFDAMAGAYK